MEWKYWKMDLNQHHPQRDEIDILDAAGEEGWELVGITSNNIAYLKRALEALAPAQKASTGRITPHKMPTEIATINGGVEVPKKSG
jgi:hypothetical protein